ncbi:RlpA-like double-psi beta-barrel-protein domain-containing protein-containing protein [Xylariaceae sp. FL1019]|nr:RlpA-like double-psi beta-barrel-protein domain-containing protein-containing protein [Xylariaceae sp. FL1019]
MSPIANALAVVAVFAASAAANSGQMTWYDPGLGACGSINSADQAVVALNIADYADGAHCGQWITIQGNGKQTAGMVVHHCPTCGSGGVDASRATFDDIAPLDHGVVDINWFFQ